MGSTSRSTLPWGALFASPFAFAAVAVIAQTFHDGETMAPEALRRRIIVLLGLSVVSTSATFAIPAIIGAIAGGEWSSEVGVIFWGPLLALPQFAVTLGIAWLIGRLRGSSKSQVRHG